MPDDFPTGDKGKRPAFRNVITTGNIIGMVGTMSAAIPAVVLILQASQWPSRIEAQVNELARVAGELQAAALRVQIREDEEDKQIAAIRGELIGIEVQLSREGQRK